MLLWTFVCMYIFQLVFLFSLGIYLGMEFLDHMVVLVERNGIPLQYSCLENPMDRGSWQATIHGATRVRHDLVTKPPPPWSSIFSFWGISILFFIVASPIYIPTNCEKGSFPPYFLQHLLFIHFLRITILTGVRYLIVVFINNSLMISKVEHLLRCLLTICMSSLQKCLFWSPAHF